MTDPVDSLWQTDMALLTALVRAVEVDGQRFPNVNTIYADLSLDKQVGRRSLGRLVEARMLITNGDRKSLGGWVVTGITERGLRQSGAWPDSTSQFAQQIVAGLAAAADAEPREDQRERIRDAASMDPDVLADVLTTILGGQPVRD